MFRLWRAGSVRRGLQEVSNRSLRCHSRGRYDANKEISNLEKVGASGLSIEARTAGCLERKLLAQLGCLPHF